MHVDGMLWMDKPLEIPEIHMMKLGEEDAAYQSMQSIIKSCKQSKIDSSRC
jgi:hypothetical protein